MSAYEQTDRNGRGLRIESVAGGADVAIEDQETMDSVTVEPHHRQAAAQALAGPDYVVVPAPSTPEHTCLGTLSTPDVCVYCGTRFDEPEATPWGEDTLRAHLTRRITWHRRLSGTDRCTCGEEWSQPHVADALLPSIQAYVTAVVKAQKSPADSDVIPVGSGSVSTAGMVRTINELITALKQTVDYIGCDTLPATPGWSWYDVLAKHAPDVLAQLVAGPEAVIFAHQRVDQEDRAGTCVCGWDEADRSGPGLSHALHVWERMQRHGVIRREIGQ